MGFLRNIVKTSLLIIVSLFVFSCSTTSTSHTEPAAQNINLELAVHFINVGEGDSTFIHAGNGENILIDAGSPAGGPEVVRYLKSLGVKKINDFIFTHSHDDHIGGIFSVLDEFEVDSFYDNGFSNFRSTIYSDYIKKVRGDLLKYNVLQAGETLHVGNVNIDVLNPLLPPAGNLNEDSIVLRLNAGDVKILLAGDMGQLGERRLLNAGTELSSRVMKIAHHGENDVCSDEFLQEVQPEKAIISVSRINKYARPHPELLKRLEDSGAEVFRTDRDGHIVFRTDGATYSVSTEK
jgi:beta-lactamase superfamily II metal-dependent hydrolase